MHLHYQRVTPCHSISCYFHEHMPYTVTSTMKPLAHDSVEIFALELVTLTPSCLARATISIRFLDETACAIL